MLHQLSSGETFPPWFAATSDPNLHKIVLIQAILIYILLFMQTFMVELIIKKEFRMQKYLDD